MSYNTQSKETSDPDTRRSTGRPSMGTRALRNKENVPPFNVISKRRDIIDTEVVQSTSGTTYTTQKRKSQEVVVTKCCGAQFDPILTRSHAVSLPSRGCRNALVDRNERPSIQTCNTKNCPAISAASSKRNAVSKPCASSALGNKCSSCKKTGPLTNSTVKKQPTSSTCIEDSTTSRINKNKGPLVKSILKKPSTSSTCAEGSPTSQITKNKEPLAKSTVKKQLTSSTCVDDSTQINKKMGPLANSTVITRSSTSAIKRFNPYSATNSHLRNNRASLPKATATVIRRTSTGKVPKKQTTSSLNTSEMPTILENDTLHIPSKLELTRTVETQRGCCCTPTPSEDSAFFSAEDSTIWATFNPPKSAATINPHRSELYFAKPILSEADKSMMIIHDGIPSVRKKTLKKEIAPSSGYKGIVNLDPQAVYVSPVILYPEYITDIIENILNKEKFSILPKHFLQRTNILNIHRTYLVNWLHKLQQHLGSDPGVLFLSIRILDKLLASLTISLNNLQLLGVLSFWLANKFSDIVEVISINKLLEYCQNIYPLKYILQAEKQLLQILNFDILSFEEPMVFVRYYIYFLQIENCNNVSFLANYLLDCLSFSADMNTFPLSLQGSASVYMSLKLLGYDTTTLWPILKKYPGFHASENLFVINERILEKVLLVQDEKYAYRQPFYKYSTEKYGYVSTLVYTELHKI